MYVHIIKIKKAESFLIEVNVNIIVMHSYITTFSEFKTT